MIMDCVDLFCGCGGLSLGFMKAGHRILAAFDNWDAALEVYRRNFTHEAVKMDLGDVNATCRAVTPLHPDMIIGGPPCQDFSSAGMRNEEGGRGGLTLAYAEIIARVRPEWFVMENVPRITKTRKLTEATAIFHEAGNLCGELHPAIR